MGQVIKKSYRFVQARFMGVRHAQTRRRGISYTAGRGLAARRGPGWAARRESVSGGSVGGITVCAEAAVAGRRVVAVVGVVRTSGRRGRR